MSVTDIYCSSIPKSHTRTVCVRSTCSFSWNLNLFFKITTTCEHSSRAYIRMLVITTKWNDIAQYASVLFTAEWICFRHPSNFMASLMFSTAQQFARNQACRYQIKDFLVAQLNAEWTVNKCSGDRIFVVFWKHRLSMKLLTVLFKKARQNMMNVFDFRILCHIHIKLIKYQLCAIMVVGYCVIFW